MDKATLDARHRVIVLLWASLLGGVTLFTGVVVALASGVIGAWEPALAPGTAALALVASPLLMVGGIAFRRGGSAPAGDAAQRLTAHQNRVVVASALQEGGGLLGLVLCLLAGQATWAVGVWALTGAAMGLCRPTRDELDALLR
ncbi:MAG: hypothetical protein AMXMBFR53_10290 [Gemmatimonadota bacterium]